MNQMENEKCGLCDGEGWQRFEITCPTFKKAHVVVRGCGCARAPLDNRHSNILKPPAWQRNDHGVWIAQTIDEMERFPCKCPSCRPLLWEARKK